MKPIIRVYIIGGQRLYTESIGALLDKCPSIDLMGSTTSPDDGFYSIRSQKIDVLLIDANLDQMDAAQLIREIRSETPSINMIIFGLDSIDEVIIEFIEAGVNGYILKDSSFQDLVRLVEQVYEGRTTCSPRLAALVFERITKLSKQSGFQRKAPEVMLTPREQEMLELITAGLSNKQIAQQLQISLFTVKNHVHNLFEKLKVSYRREAIRYAHENGLIEKNWFARPASGRAVSPQTEHNGGMRKSGSYDVAR